RLAFEFRQRIRKAISKIQFGRVAACFSEVSVSLPRNAGLRFADGFNGNICFLNQFIKAAAGDRVLASVNHCSGFDVADRRNTRLAGGLNNFSEFMRLRLETKNNDQRGSVKNHRGSPFSSYRRSPWSTERYRPFKRVEQSRPIRNNLSESFSVL